uniref:Secreted protein n=1 Tax=Trichogramma kaykai TaxID=54128 RepID=A0ABD2WF15_9HYME
MSGAVVSQLALPYASAILVVAAATTAARESCVMYEHCQDFAVQRVLCGARERRIVKGERERDRDEETAAAATPWREKKYEEARRAEE